MLEVYNVLFDFRRANTQEFSLRLRGGFELGLLSNDATVETLETLGDRPNAF
jgi:hypothetical protein